MAWLTLEQGRNGEAAESKVVWVYRRDDVTRVMESFTYGHVMVAVS